MLTQYEAIINYIDRYGSITTLDAAKELDITKLPTRIGEMKRKGIPIEQKEEHRKNAQGKSVSYMRYWLKKEEK